MRSALRMFAVSGVLGVWSVMKSASAMIWSTDAGMQSSCSIASGVLKGS